MSGFLSIIVTKEIIIIAAGHGETRNYERASVIVTSKAFGAWREILGDEITAGAMIDRLVHHAGCAREVAVFEAVAVAFGARGSQANASGAPAAALNA